MEWYLISLIPGFASIWVKIKSRGGSEYQKLKGTFISELLLSATFATFLMTFESDRRIFVAPIVVFQLIGAWLTFQLMRHEKIRLNKIESLDPASN